MPKITTLLLDCDNTLVLSEDLAFEACAEVANTILQKHSIAKTYTGAELIEDFVGMNFRGMMGALQTKFSFTMTPSETETFVKAEEDQVIAKISAEGQPCIGCNEVLAQLAADKKYELAIVSSSAERRVRASVRKVGQDVFFPEKNVFSAATSLPTPTSKPDPAIYLHACKVLGKEAGECVAVEDSKSGALSGVRAGIHVIGYVGSYHTEEKRREMVKVLKDVGAVVVIAHWNEFFEALKTVENM